ncbi:hypothetical protein A2856_02960 [Candidatus Uhrbacteria bacterium RIFCSPHIGHO2_01_FULL_63_20]|uniref:Fido domain-containing protein n=1 Tax=Candidatus Uhrbacteria bacterium RIFCSPHIGHO2_01_FULL_63_20 TaxID=1802385 RepID=A0A1F7TL44_9BACT|nr:MAG: hypothetical protein A2856_02960 [Candidatus Uhrbacteria bacterium RIFCSPHIGHO2_01_FULL_63_20]
MMREMCHALAVALFDKYEEPIPPFEEHDPRKLESILGNPQQTYGGQELYPMLISKAAILYYSMIKGHAFANGNKRISTTSLLVFLAMNKKWISCPQDEVVQKAVTIAESSATVKDAVLHELNIWIETRLIDQPRA